MTAMAQVFPVTLGRSGAAARCAAAARPWCRSSPRPAPTWPATTACSPRARAGESGCDSSPPAPAPRTRRCRRGLTGSPWSGVCRGRTRASQVPGLSSCVRAVVQDPAGCDPPFARGTQEGRHRLQGVQRPGHPGWHSFRGYQPTAHTLACLRIAGPVTGAVARLTTDPGGLTPGRAGFAPAGRPTKFHGDIATSDSLRPALPGRTELPICTPADLRGSFRVAGGVGWKATGAHARSHLFCCRRDEKVRLPELAG